MARMVRVLVAMGLIAGLGSLAVAAALSHKGGTLEKAAEQISSQPGKSLNDALAAVRLLDIVDGGESRSGLAQREGALERVEISVDAIACPLPSGVSEGMDFENAIDTGPDRLNELPLPPYWLSGGPEPDFPVALPDGGVHHDPIEPLPLQ
jgi:hypothetical protein